MINKSKRSFILSSLTLILLLWPASLRAENHCLGVDIGGVLRTFSDPTLFKLELDYRFLPGPIGWDLALFYSTSVLALFDDVPELHLTGVFAGPVLKLSRIDERDGWWLRLRGFGGYGIAIFKEAGIPDYSEEGLFLGGDVTLGFNYSLNSRWTLDPFGTIRFHRLLDYKVNNLFPVFGAYLGQKF